MSFRLWLVMRIMALVAKPRLRHVKTPEEARRSFERTARWVFRQPPFSLYMPDHFTGPSGARPALWVSSGKYDRRRVILYLHGGGYIVGSAQTHAAVCARLSQLSGFSVFLPDYRLAPEHPYPAALEDAEAAFDDLIARGFAPADIVIGGDSAGGGLALALLSRLCTRGMQPAGTFTWSPWTDLTLSGASLERNADSDVLLPVSRIKEMRAYYAADTAPDDAGLSPLFARFPGCPPVLIQWSRSEILADDSERMAAHLRAEGADVQMQTWPKAPHVWQILDGLVPEARDALQNTADFVRRALVEALPRPQGEN